MGTDIHLRVQGKTAEGWEYVKTQPFPKYGDAGFSFDEGPCVRDYRVFALLAGVRNGTGFAGIRTHKPVDPAFAGRGLPDGVTEDDGPAPDPDSDEDPFFLAGSNSIGDHSFTHATLAELRAVRWDTPFVYPDGTSTLEDCEFRAWLTSPAMLAIEAKYGGADNVRVIIGFDS